MRSSKSMCMGLDAALAHLICRPCATRSVCSEDRKVLRFHGFWDDHTKYGARTYFNIHYYLADNTMEFNEESPETEAIDTEVQDA